MKIILSHRYLDFDALASMVAVQKLYPDALLVIEGSYGSFVQDFLALAKEHIPYYRLKDIDVSKVKNIILVDTFELSRSIANPEILKQLKNVELEVIDHHPFSNPDSSKATIEMLGACTTILVEKIIQKGLKLSSFDATLLALGIYDDTGSLLFENTTARDLRAVAYLLEQGAQLGVIAEYLHRPLTSEQMELFQQLLDNGSTESFEKTPVYISYAEYGEYFGGLALLAHRIGEIESADIWFIVVKMENRVYIVGRARGTGFPVNKIVQAFGGSGHAKAASAVIKGSDLPTVISRLKDEILSRVEKPGLVRDIMSYPVKTVFPDTSISEVGQLLLKYGHTGVPVVEDEKLAGVISRRDVDKALKHGLDHAPVKGFMTREVVSVDSDQSWEEAQKLMILHDIGRLPVVENGRLVGIISRSDVLPLVYGSVLPTSDELARERSMARREEILNLIDQLPESIKRVLNVIREAASQMEVRAYLVGGFVRDLLLRFPTSDLDIVVEGNGIEFAEQLSRKLQPVKLTPHKAFGTARLLLSDGTHLDIAGSRREDYDFPGALPKVEESTLSDDLFRRDFTINAMALCLREDRFGEIIDYYGGFRDLQQGEIRFLHNLSFIEDPTRILRAVRFAERYGFKLAKFTRDGIITSLEAGVLTKISPERFTEELILIYNESAYQKMGQKLIEHGIYSSWFGTEYPWDYSIKDEAVTDWTLEKRWLVSIRYIDAPGIRKILEHLRMQKQLHTLTLDYLHLREEIKLKIAGEDLAELDLLLSDVPQVLREVFLLQNEFADIIKQYIIALSGMNTQITGSKLIELGFREGPQIGAMLRKIRSLWLKGEINNPDEEEAYITKLIDSGTDCIMDND